MVAFDNRHKQPGESVESLQNLLRITTLSIEYIPPKSTSRNASGSFVCEKVVLLPSIALDATVPMLQEEDWVAFPVIAMLVPEEKTWSSKICICWPVVEANVIFFALHSMFLADAFKDWDRLSVCCSLDTILSTGIVLAGWYWRCSRYPPPQNNHQVLPECLSGSPLQHVDWSRGAQEQ